MKKEIEYREIKLDECNEKLLKNFIRYQKIEKSLKPVEGGYEEINKNYVIDWDETDRKNFLQFFKERLMYGNVFVGAFSRGELKGLMLLENKMYGEKSRYINLCKLYVSNDFRGRGIGKKLFNIALEESKKLDGEKMFISAGSSVDTMKFYERQGCVKALEVVKEYEYECIPDCPIEITL